MVDQDHPNFIIYAMPRSRTAWLAHLLTYRAWVCFHEGGRFMREVDHIRQFFTQPRMGSAETAAAPCWALIRDAVPGLREVVIRRPVEEIVASILAVDVSSVAVYDEAKLRTGIARGAKRLDRIALQPGVLTFDYDDLDHEDACRAIFEHCLPYPFDREWYEKVRGINVQADMVKILTYHFENHDAIEGFKRKMKAELWQAGRRVLRQMEA